MRRVSTAIAAIALSTTMAPIVAIEHPPFYIVRLTLSEPAVAAGGALTTATLSLVDAVGNAVVLDQTQPLSVAATIADGAVTSPSQRVAVSAAAATIEAGSSSTSFTVLTPSTLAIGSIVHVTASVGLLADISADLIIGSPIGGG